MLRHLGFVPEEELNRLMRYSRVALIILFSLSFKALTETDVNVRTYAGNPGFKSLLRIGVMLCRAE